MAPITQITDDVDGSRDGTEIQFAFDGVEYTLDLSKKNRAAFEKAIQPYRDAATKVSRRSGTRRAAPTPSRDLAAVRARAASRGIAVSGRGRISAAVLAQYDAAH